MKRISLALAIALSATTHLGAQSNPFDMTPERPTTLPLDPAPMPVTPTEPQSATPPRTQTPLVRPQVSAPPPSEFRRQLLPSGDMMLRGENAAQSFVIHMTSAQAAAPMRLHVGYSNAIVVAPEASRLQLLINDTVVIETQVRSSEGLTNLDAEIPAGLLRAGRNEISIRASHRHRTDCTIDSTYELWTSVNAAQTYLTSTDTSIIALSSVEDLRTLAPNASGSTTIAIVAPGLSRSDIGADVMKLAQTIALYVPLPNLNYAIDAAPSPDHDNAALTVYVGTEEELAPLGVTVPDAARAGPVSAFTDAQNGAPTFVVSGRSRAELLVALDQMLAPVDRAAGTQREALVTEAWRMPNAPMIYGARELSFSELGVRSEQFSGRRHTTSFQFAVPADYYADSYGEAQILLDAAYAQDVLPGSLINVYINGSIAVSMPLNETRGAVFEQVPIRLTMRHFKPGINDVTIMANLSTAEDDTCVAGSVDETTPRFAIFNSSRFQVPDFARIGQRPNLAALGGTGFPYGRQGGPTPIFVERTDAATLSVTADLLARMALSAGRALPVSFTTSIDATRDADAIFVGTINAIPPQVLSQVNVSEESRSFWLTSHGGAPVGNNGGQADAEAWRRQMEQRSWMNEIEDWFKRTFDLDLKTLRFAPGSEAAFVPSQPAKILLAQGQNPAGSGVWTLVAAPDATMLREGVSAVTNLPNWNRLSGRLVTLDTDLETISALPVTKHSFVETVPFSIGNFRLIIANWLSGNILSYSLLLVGACTLLGIATSALLSLLGRRR